MRANIRGFKRGFLCGLIFFYYLFASLFFGVVKVHPQQSFYLITENELSGLESSAATMREELRMSRNEQSRLSELLNSSETDLSLLMGNYREYRELSQQLRQEDELKLIQQQGVISGLQNDKNLLTEKTHKQKLMIVYLTAALVGAGVLLGLGAYLKLRCLV